MSRTKARPHLLSRREFAVAGGSALLAAYGGGLQVLASPVRAHGALASMIAAGVPSVVPDTANSLAAESSVVPLHAATSGGQISVRLDPADISNFTVFGNQRPATGAVLRFSDADAADVSALFAADPGAATGNELDLTATFQVQPQILDGVDADFQLVINDGPSGRAAIAACILVNGVPHIGLVGPGPRDTLAAYPAFIAAEWQAAQLTLKIRRTADGGVQILEINGAPPAVRTELLGPQTAQRVRAEVTSELGCYSVKGTVAAEVSSFFTERAFIPKEGKLTFTRFRVRDTDSADRLAFRADYQLAANTDGIDPSRETVVIKLSTGGAEFYSQTINGFTQRGQAPRRRWVITDAERARTGIEQLVIEEDPANSGSIFLRDVRTDVGNRDFRNVVAEVTIGNGTDADKLTGAATLVEKPAGSGRWRLKSEP